MTRVESSEKARLFTGIPIPDDVRSAISEASERVLGAVEDVRLVPAENMHITLKFLGIFELCSVSVIEEALRKAAAGLPTALIIGGAGAFPSAGSARVIWVGVKDVDGGAAKAHRIVEKAAERCGVPREKRAYRPHITIGRAGRKPVRLPAELESAFDFEVRFEAGELALFRSYLSGTGARYTVISREGLTDPRGSAKG